MAQRIERAVLAVLIVLLAGCAAPGDDRFESVNRKIYAFNNGFDSVVTKPLATQYVAITPQPVRTGVTNFFNNINQPLTIVNQFLQGKPKLGFEDTGRFLLNSTVGLAGLFDVATPMGLPYHFEDFGQTLGVWGVPAGDYLVLPIWGPVTTRGAFGDAVGLWFFPPRYMGEAEHRAAVLGLNVVNVRANLLGTQDLLQGDQYIFVRDGWIQRREYLTNDGVIDDPFADGF